MTTLLNNLPALQGTFSVSLSDAVGTPGDELATLTIDGETMTVVAGVGSVNLTVDRGTDATAHAVGATATYAAGVVASTPSMVVRAGSQDFTLTASAPISSFSGGGVLAGVSISFQAVLTAGQGVLAQPLWWYQAYNATEADDLTLVITISDALGTNAATVYSFLGLLSEGAVPAGNGQADFAGDQTPSITGMDLSVSEGAIVSAAGGSYWVTVNLNITPD